MSWYVKAQSVLSDIAPGKEWWTKVYKPGETVVVSGIYTCTGCKREVTSNKGDPFPTQNHHQHDPKLGDIGWKLNVRTNTEGD